MTEQFSANEVVLVGRVSREPEEKELPSGDLLVQWTVTVDRPPPGPRAPEGTTTVDSIDCVAWAAGVRRVARAFVAGDVVRVEGALRRRFWRGSSGAASKVEVEVANVKRLARAHEVTRKT